MHIILQKGHKNNFDSLALVINESFDHSEFWPFLEDYILSGWLIQIDSMCFLISSHFLLPSSKKKKEKTPPPFYLYIYIYIIRHSNLSVSNSNFRCN